MNICSHFKKINIILFVYILITLSGCALFQPNKPMPDDPHYAPISPEYLVAPPSENGSLYHEGFGLSLYEDLSARRIGDLLTVRLEEKANSSTNTTANALKQPNIDAGGAVDSLASAGILGSTLNFNAPGILPLDSNENNNLSFRWKDKNQFNGSGDSSQNHELKDALITVTVSEVLPNGNMMIRGEKWINLNQNDQFIRITGIVRQVDIDSSNTVSSQKIANARISYGGTGLVSDSSAPGWLTRFFFTAIWPF